MEEIQPLEDVPHVYIERPGLSEEQCVWSGEPIPLDEYAVSFYAPHTSKTVLAWLRLGSIEPLCDALERADDDGVFERAVGVSRRSVSKNHCCTCGERINDMMSVVSFSNPQVGTQAVVHVSCAPALADALDSVWAYADALLTTSL